MHMFASVSSALSKFVFSSKLCVEQYRPLLFRCQVRNFWPIPPWEYHIRVDKAVGRKRPCRDVLDRCHRLDHGMWIRNRAGKKRLRWNMSKSLAHVSLQHMMMSKYECRLLDAMMTPYWLRPHYYINDPYKPYQSRYGLDMPRMHYTNKKFVRERQKVLMDDITSDKYFNERIG